MIGIKVPRALRARIDQERLAWGAINPSRSQVGRSLLLTALAVIEAGIVPRNAEGLQGLMREIALRPLTPSTHAKEILLVNAEPERKTA